MRIQRKLAGILSGALLATGVAAVSNPAVAVDDFDRGCDYFDAGNGSAVNPYQIANYEDLEAISYADCFDSNDVYVGDAFEVDAYFVQVADIDLTMYYEWSGNDQWTPIGGVYNEWEDDFEDIDGSYGEGGAFDGQYDGQDHSITNIHIEDNGFEHTSGYGLFGHTDDATIENLAIEVMVDVQSYWDEDIAYAYFNQDNNDFYYEGFTGWWDVDDSEYIFEDGSNGYWDYEIDTCWYSTDIGGLIGHADDTVVRDVDAVVDIRGAVDVGGLIGEADGEDTGTKIINSTVTGTVEADSLCGSENIGGMIGYAQDDAEVVNSSADVDVNSLNEDDNMYDRYDIDESHTYDQRDWVYGLPTYYHNSYSVTDDAYNNDRFDFLDEDHIGGLIGETEDTLIINTVSTGDVDAYYSDDVGGLVGYSEGSSFVDSSATGDVRVIGDMDAIGGLVGMIEDDGDARNVIQNSFATGDVTALGSESVGGLLGEAYDDDDTYAAAIMIVDSYATGVVKGDRSVGGLVGSANLHSITNSYATGEVHSDGSNSGGLVGYMNDASSIFNSHATGSVNGGTNDAGGLVGFWNGRGTVSRSYATGDVFSSNNGEEESETGFGGLIGHVQDDVLVDKSYSTGDVDITAAFNDVNEIGGFIGIVGYDVSIRSSYSTGDVKGFYEDRGGYESYAVGGFIGLVGGGESEDIQVRNSYSRGSVEGTGVVGGFIGTVALDRQDVELRNNYTTSAVTAEEYPRDLFANVMFDRSPAWGKTNVFVSSINVGSSVQATRVTLANMNASAIKALGWQTSETGAWSTRTWSLCSKVNDGLPYLSWQTEADLCVCEGVVIPDVMFNTRTAVLDAGDIAQIKLAAKAIADAKCKNVTLVGFTNTRAGGLQARTLADARSTAVSVALKKALWTLGHPVNFTFARDVNNTTAVRWNKVSLTAAE
jgi:hypothetical protein